jgi:DNA repair protein RecO (recombination protein O)
VPAFAVKLLSMAGYHPQLQACAGCGDVTRLESFSPAIGGALCARCEREDRTALPLAGGRIALLAGLLAADFGVPLDDAVADDLTNALRLYAEYHLERPLRSMRVLSSSS